MSNQLSNSDYKNLEDFMEGGEEEFDVPKDQPQKPEPKSMAWILFACTATVCFALSAYILGIISVGGVSGKFLNSWGYLFVSVCILFTKNVRFCKARSKHFKDHPEDKENLSYFATLKDSCYYDTEKGTYKWLGLFLSFICGLLNLGGEFGIIFSFQHALNSLMNQGILTSLFTLGAIIVLLGSVLILKEHVRFCEVS